MAYRYLFGPVPSRRLGLSLGVDLMPPKTCSLNCVYCECGGTTHLTVTPGEYVPVSEIQEELEAFLSEGPQLDYVTFSGAGEPTLHSGIGDIVSFLRSRFPQYRIALLTNGSLLYREDVRARLLSIDLVVVSVDAATRSVFDCVNRPHPGLSLEEMEAGLIAFREVYSHALWVEVFLVPGVNDTTEELLALRDMLARIRPDKIQLNTLDRPGAEAWVAPLDAEGLARAASFLQTAELIASPRGRSSDDSLSPDDRILSAIRRRPMTAEDISRMMGLDEADVAMRLDALLGEGAIHRMEMPRGIFYSAGEAARCEP